MCNIIRKILISVCHYFQRSQTVTLIKDSQRGFRKGSSCLTNLLLFLDQILRSVDERYCADVVFLDLAKAFDKVPYLILLEKLKTRY